MDLPDAPPGTEGFEEEILSKRGLFDSDSTKAEKEFQEHLSSLLIKLDDGTNKPMVGRQGRDVSGKWIYLCYPCQAVCSGEAVLQLHISGKKHKSRLAVKLTWPVSIYDDHPYIRSTKGELNVNTASNEVLQKIAATAMTHNMNPDDLEAMFKKLRNKECFVESILKDVKAPLIGLEYLIEFLPEEEHHEPSYLCVLCNKNGHRRTIVNHLVSFWHRSHYLARHFNKAYQKLSPYRNNAQYREAVNNTVLRLAHRIEKKFGRLVPLQMNKYEYEKQKDMIVKYMFKDKKCHEDSGDTFEEVIDNDLITTLSENDKEHKVEIIREEPKKRDPSPPIVKAPRRPEQTEYRVRRERSRSPRDIPLTRAERSVREYKRYSRRSRSRSHGRSRSRSHGRIDRHRISRSKSPRKFPPREIRDTKLVFNTRYKKDNRFISQEKEDVNKHYKVNKDHKLILLQVRVTNAKTAARKTLAYHEKNPEKHPQYPEEWKKFWNRRYKELQQEGKDPSKHDFKPEWIVFWTRRMKELHREELRSQILDMYRQLNLSPPSVEHILDSPKQKSPTPTRRIEQSGSRKRSRSRSRTTENYKRPAHFMPLDTDQISDDELKGDEHLSNWDSDSLESLSSLPDQKPIVSYTQIKPSSISSRSTSKGTRGYDRPHSHSKNRESHSRMTEPPPMPETDDVVSSLRLLVALEDYLGSLGPKIVDLLTVALKMEKEEPNSSENILDDEMKVALIETAKEKLKGSLQTGIVKGETATAARKAIVKAAALTHKADTRTKYKPTVVPTSSKTIAPMPVPGVGKVDKAAIAQQIAAALIEQGKTDVTTEELAELVDAVIGMADEKKRAMTEDKKTPAMSGTATALQLLQDAYDEQQAKEDKKPSTTTTAMDALSDSDLETLLQNFTELSADEQNGLITYLKKLESKEPHRVERLREFVSAAISHSEAPKDKNPTPSPAPTAVEKVMKKIEKPLPQSISVDSDDEEYSVDDIFKSAANKVKENEKKEEKKAQETATKEQPDNEISNMPSVTQDQYNAIANILSSLQGQQNSALNLLNLVQSSAAQLQIPVVPMFNPAQVTETHAPLVPKIPELHPVSRPSGNNMDNFNFPNSSHLNYQQDNSRNNFQNETHKDPTFFDIGVSSSNYNNQYANDNLNSNYNEFTVDSYENNYNENNYIQSNNDYGQGNTDYNQSNSEYGNYNQHNNYGNNEMQQGNYDYDQGNYNQNNFQGGSGYQGSSGLNNQRGGNNFDMKLARGGRGNRGPGGRGGNRGGRRGGRMGRGGK